MTAEFDVSTSKKCRVQIFDTDKCVFCPEPFIAKGPGIYQMYTKSSLFGLPALNVRMMWVKNFCPKSQKF